MNITQQSGIYKITNKANGTFYIGSAVKLSYRWSNHKSYLKKGTHHNPILQKAWNKYGESGFVFSVLEIVECAENLIESEQKWLNETNAAIAIISTQSLTAICVCQSLAQTANEYKEVCVKDVATPATNT